MCYVKGAFKLMVVIEREVQSNSCLCLVECNVVYVYILRIIQKEWVETESYEQWSKIFGEIPTVL